MYPQNFYNNWGPPMGSSWFSGAWGPLFGLIVFLVVVWSIAWKGLALWKSARIGSKVWFIVLLIVNTLGILEILYLYVFSKKHGQAADSGASAEAK